MINIQSGKLIASLLTVGGLLLEQTPALASLSITAHYKNQAPLKVEIKNNRVAYTGIQEMAIEAYCLFNSKNTDCRKYNIAKNTLTNTLQIYNERILRGAPARDVNQTMTYYNDGPKVQFVGKLPIFRISDIRHTTLNYIEAAKRVRDNNKDIQRSIERLAIVSNNLKRLNKLPDDTYELLMEQAKWCISRNGQQPFLVGSSIVCGQPFNAQVQSHCPTGKRHLRSGVQLTRAKQEEQNFCTAIAPPILPGEDSGSQGNLQGKDNPGSPKPNPGSQKDSQGKDNPGSPKPNPSTPVVINPGGVPPTPPETSPPGSSPNLATNPQGSPTARPPGQANLSNGEKNSKLSLQAQFLRLNAKRLANDATQLKQFAEKRIDHLEAMSNLEHQILLFQQQNMESYIQKGAEAIAGQGRYIEAYRRNVDLPTQRLFLPSQRTRDTQLIPFP